MLCVQPNPGVASWLSTLLSGAIAAVVAAGITIAASFVLDRNNKIWAVQLALRKHRVDRLIQASDGLRTAFFTAWTQLQHHGLNLRNIAYYKSLRTDDSEDQEEQRQASQTETSRYNQEVTQTESNARSYLAFLESEYISDGLRLRIRALYFEIAAGQTFGIDSVDERLKYYGSIEERVLALLRELDEEISSAIKSPAV